MSQLVILSERGADRRSPPFFKTKKLAILGNTHSLQYAPWHDTSWTLAAHPCCRPRLEREPDWYFDLHGPQNFRTEKKAWSNHYYTWLKNLQTPIFMQKNWADIPLAVKFPRERILAEFRAYFTNHAAWMVALAITEGLTHVGIFGCEYKHEQERGKQRGSLEYWLGVFETLGGQVVLPLGSTLLNDPAELYGYESHGPDGKLLESYRMPASIAARTPCGDPIQRHLKYLVSDTLEGRIPLMRLPEGEQPAWERSRLRLHG